MLHIRPTHLQEVRRPFSLMLVRAGVDHAAFESGGQGYQSFIFELIEPLGVVPRGS
jgi:hypothetical protein